MSLYDSYVDPDIPGVFTSVTDQSIAQEGTSNSRKVLIIAPSKFGDNRIMEFSETEQLKNTLGAENSFKYGVGQFYAKSFIKAGATVLFKRIDDAKATYANLLLHKTNSGNGDAFEALNFQSIYNKDTLTTPEVDGNPQIELIKENTVLSLLAKGRGRGYNDLFAVYNAVPEYEKFEADDEGIVNYKFNFVNVTINENTGTEILKKANTILFSLMDIDPLTKNVISHRTNGSTLHINNIVEASNPYISARINEPFLEEMRLYPNIDSLLVTKEKPFLFIESELTYANPNLTVSERIFYEVQVNDSVSPAQFRIQRAVFTPNRQFTAAPTFKVGDKNYVLSVANNNGKLSIKASEIVITAGEPTYADGSVAYIDGDNAFYTFKLEKDVNDKIVFKTEVFKFLRWELYNYLMTYNTMLAGGEDSSSNSSTGFVKMDGSANIDAIANATYLYIRDDKEIREVLYPKKTFNYIIDWTGSVKVKDIMFLLADRLRRTMHIGSCPSVRLNETGLSPDLSKENDVICREQYLPRSSYNTMLYSSQHNKTHLDTETKITYKLPACYYALLNHIYTDLDPNFGITEPVANNIKGKIRTTNLKLSHELSSDEIAELRKLQINCIVTDASENYFIDQKTAYKKNSKLSLGNVVKTLQELQTILPTKLKPYVQKKETDVAITSDALNEIQETLKPYKTSTNSKDSIFKSITVKTSFESNVLTIMLRVTPAGTTEKIQVPIIVEG